MTIRLSSALRSALVTNFGLGSLLNFGRVLIYDGTQTPSADANQGASVQLATISTDAITPVPGTTTGGLQLAGGPQAGQLIMVGNWMVKGIATGTAAWWRFISTSDPEVRMDGAVGQSLIMPNTSITPATLEAVIAFNLILPSQ